MNKKKLFFKNRNVKIDRCDSIALRIELKEIKRYINASIEKFRFFLKDE